LPTPLNTVDPARDGAGIVAKRGQPNSALLHDRAAVAKIGMSIGLVIAGRQIERAEARLYPARLIRILDPDVRRHARVFTTVIIAGIRIVGASGCNGVATNFGNARSLTRTWGACPGWAGDM